MNSARLLAPPRRGRPSRELRPEVYGGRKAGTVTAALRPFGINVMDVWSAPDGGGKSTT